MKRGHMTWTWLCQLLLTVVIMSLISQVSGKGVIITDDMKENDRNQYSNITDDIEDIEEIYGNYTSSALPWTNSSVPEDMEENYSNYSSIPMDSIPMDKSITGDATTGCSGVFNSSRGVLRHPMSCGNYQNNEECIWIIRASNPINIKFVNFNTENKLDYLYVRDGESNDSNLLGKLSGNIIPSSIRTSTNVAHLRFTSDDSINNTGFELHWQSIGCGSGSGGGEYRSSTGMIRYPRSGVNYQDNEWCTWIIRAEDRIKISFVTFDTSNSNDYLTILDGESSGSQILGNFSGDTIPSSVMTSTNVAYLHFTSVCSISNSGFELHWQSIGCGGEYNSSSGMIRHPMSGGNYQDNDHCTWIIKAENRIKITFVTFDTYDSYDFLTIRDGESTDSNVLGKFHGSTFSGANVPKSVQTRTNAAHLLFTSNAGGTRTGFQLHWEPLGCGGKYNSSSGMIRHPVSGGNYQDNEYCTWIIKAEDRIKITFVIFDTYDRYDVLTIRDGESIDSNVLGKFYGSKFSGANVPGSLQTRTNAAHLLFTSNAGGTRTGFQLHWEPIGCGGEFNSTSGIIRHPMSENYQNNEDCIWIIRDPTPTPYLTIEFIRFNIEGKLDYLYVRDGKSNGSPLLGNFTGDNKPASVQTSKNVAYLHFTSDDSITSTGFELHWQSGCIGKFFKSRGSEQCFKLFTDKKRSWEDANTKCVSEGLQLAEPSEAAAVTLRKYLVDVYSAQYGNDVKSWLGARGDGYKFVWRRSGATLRSDSHLWNDGPGISSFTTRHCLELNAYLDGLRAAPLRPYDVTVCSVTLYTLCEVTSE